MAKQNKQDQNDLADIPFDFGPEEPKVPGYYIRIWVEDEKGARWGYLRFPGGPMAGHRIVFPDGDTALPQLVAARDFFGQAKLSPADRPANLISAS